MNKNRGLRPPFHMNCSPGPTEHLLGIPSPSPLKWAGGKRWLLQELQQVLPDRFDWYFEPFAGGASVFFSLSPRRAALADLNGELIATYVAIRENVKDVWRVLGRHARNHSDSYYYQVRDRKPKSPAEIAARFLYLNRTCWNGLFRVNLNGHFNVPRGTKNEVIQPAEKPEDYSRILQGAELLWADFEMIVDGAGMGDLIYADPPYTVKHNFNGFVKYNESIFSWDDQERLASALRRAVKRGAHVVVSNADHESIRNLYARDFLTKSISRKSVIAGDSRYRASTSELLIVGQPGKTLITQKVR
jgi:DNA adenine methylase